MESLSSAEARRLAIAAQGLADPRPTGRVDRRHLRRVFGRVGLIQIDSVNVLARAHYVAPFARIGRYRQDLLDRMAYRDRELFEYWGHEASLIPIELHPLFRWRMHRGDAWGGMRKVARERPDYVEDVFRQVQERGPLAVSDLSDPGERRGPWWGWADGKRTLEWLYWTGRLAVASRRNFERLYDIPERVIPLEILNVATPSEEDAHRELVRIASRALGVATVADLAEYVRLTTAEARPRVAELVDEGALVPVEVEGWKGSAFRSPSVRLPRSVAAGALLSPFDSLVWFRARVERVFGFRYRIEIYTPLEKRTYGYYVLPFLLGDRLVARLDVRARRKERLLEVPASYLEEGADRGAVAEAASLELTELMQWLGLDRVTVGRRGSLASALAAAMRTERG